MLHPSDPDVSKGETLVAKDVNSVVFGYFVRDQTVPESRSMQNREMRM